MPYKHGQRAGRFLRISTDNGALTSTIRSLVEKMNRASLVLNARILLANTKVLDFDFEIDSLLLLF